MCDLKGRFIALADYGSTTVNAIWMITQVI